ncbi:hypothetical protein FLJC2902T_11640 [Flavobacterium limnosediminis JC2902]|uniref:DUF4760 domain-containing protein n=1 Tax=Flavobacterium limnosediminis JC2902 TaxID=1341181 RepID=V6SRP1_9FLAO|nr:hypothetical protein [Flavobacterium limnosediminis]ESU29124.1 hypothetical protein FLJC2902T_11640 [Flavobacterium limnosediminis JC2902]
MITTNSGFEVLVISIILILVYVIGYELIRRLEAPVEKKYELSLRLMASLSFFLVIYNIYVSIRSNDRIEENRASYNTIENIQRNWLDPQKELLQNYPEGYFLYSSMNQDAAFGNEVPQKYDATKRKQLEVYYSLRIFQSMEDFLTTGKYDKTGQSVWVNAYLMWMQSPILRFYWTKLSFNFSQDTREFVAKIIEKSDELIALRKKKGKLTNEDYDAISTKFKVNLR